MFKIHKFFWIALITLAVSIEFGAKFSYAATQIKSSSVYTVVKDGKSYKCSKPKKSIQFVVRQGGKYLLGSEAVAKLVAQQKASGTFGRAAQKRKLAALKAKVREGVAACRNPDSDATPGSSSLAPFSRALTRADIKYLLDKAALGLSSREESLVTLGKEQGISALVKELLKTHDEPAGLEDRVADELDGQIGTNTTQTPKGQRQALLDLWSNTNNPYQEKFALFLLSVWTVSGDVISDETFRGAFWDYYARLRTYAYANEALPDLGVAITKDPLMLLYLNNDLNVKGNPNENYARELMELFTLGPTDLDGSPNYTETKTDGSGDIAVAARMLTGWTVNLNYSTLKLDANYQSSRHENGPHVMFAGKPYHFSGEDYQDLVRGIFAHHPGAAVYYSREILKSYVTPRPPRALVEAFASVIAEHGFRLKEAMKILLSSEAFFDPVYRDTVPLNSLEFAAKTSRLLEMYGAVNFNYAQEQLDKMGILFNQAPSVFWYNPNVWSSSSVILEKANFVSTILEDTSAQAAGGWTPAKVLGSSDKTVPEVIEDARSTVGLGELSSAHLADLTSYMTRQRQYDGTYTSFSYHNTNAAHRKSKGLGLYYLFLLSPEFNLM